ncbi:MAG: glutathione S-transferase family protein [Candidatus Binataceae bacterium]|jgi:glutathione S-transferase
MIKLYGTSKSRSARCLWALEELGLSYEHIPVEVAKAKTPEHLKLNPNGHIPILDDDGLILWESMAINFYLAEKYGKASLWPTTIEAHATIYQMSFWGMTEIEPHLISALRHRIFYPPEQRSEQAAQQAIDTLKAPFKVLDGLLKGRDYILGKEFTIADLNVAAIMSYVMVLKLDLSATPATQGWLQKCLGREANQRARSKP